MVHGSGQPVAGEQGAWLGNIQYVGETWIPERRVAYLQTLYQFNLADPANHPDVQPVP